MKITKEQFAVIAEKHNWKADAISLETGISKSRCYGLISECKAKGITASVKTEPIVKEAVQALPIVREEVVKPYVHEVSVSNSNFDTSSLIPKASPFKYEYRDNVDGALDFWVGKQNVFTALIGEGSVGKTEACREFARRNGLPFLLVPCEDNGVALRQLLGTPGAENGSVNESTWQEGLLSIVIKKPCVILFDEVNCLPASKLFMLHELRDSRKLFVHGAPPKYSVIHAHPEARIICALNPAGNKYSGTNRLNCALASGMATIEVPDFDHEAIKLNCPNESLVKKFYGEARRAIKTQGLRVIIGRRHLERIAKALNNGATLRQAVCEGFINSAFLTTSAEERQGLYNLAIAVFGLDKFETEKPSTES